ncbi:MAG: indole-3-glycerol phosphate synthase [Phycisphaerae bacterium]|nr:indole-3-glycerol phosphate synthase [Phycisphaerae bacterium]MBM90089.1 indole-3-glycerol phosphate synthase [Phycisphaerae bacterium]
MPATLREIIEHKRGEVARAKASTPVSELRARAEDAEPARDFFEALTEPRPSANETRVIAEVKRRSPSAGLIRPEYDADGFDPADIAQKYSKGGASAISCLTDEKFFGGSLGFIQPIKDQIALPVLRKDFIIDPYQIVEARAHGADAVLLIAECLNDEHIRELLDASNELGLSALLEVHSRQNLQRVLPILEEPLNPRTLLGINNRDLTRMVTDLGQTTELLKLVPDPSMLVSESGIRTSDDLAHLRSHGVHITLIGEHLMRQPDPGQALKAMLEPVD